MKGKTRLPLLITAIPKSGSSFFAECVLCQYLMLAGMQNGCREYPRWWDFGNGGSDWDLRPEIADIHNYESRSVFKSHFAATGKNLAILDLFPNMKYVILLRDPKDQLAAEYCSTLYGPISMRYNPIFPIDADYILNSGIDAGIEYLIDNYLIHSLLWMSDWMLKRDPARSAVVTYEEFTTDSVTCLQKANMLFFDTALNPEHTQWIYSHVEPQLARKRPIEHYPRGWTGKIGIWESYFSKENSRRFDKKLSDFFGIYPCGELQSLYGD